jgi:hypothetical protein
MAKETPPFTWTGWSVGQAADFATAASTYLQKLSQAEDLQDRAIAHVEFVQMQIEMCNKRAKGLSDALAATNNYMGVFVSLLQRGRYLDEMARKSPPYRETGGKGQEPHRSAERPHGQSAADPTHERATDHARSDEPAKPERRK